ncbi:MAG: restriction endonuclease, partial [bacterium]
FGLTEEERKAVIPSNQQTYISNRVSWARSHMRAAGLIENPKRGIARITDLGLKHLKSGPDKINVVYLKQFPSYLDFIGASGKNNDSDTVVEVGQTPEELIDGSVSTLANALIDEVLEKLRKCSPAFFEHIVVDLLLKMGYGGITGKGEVTQFSNDGGLDGIINQDKLGLDIVCIQAKRWENTVGRPVVQGFVGSMDYVRAKKGVIITTSRFSREAEDYVQRVEGKKVVLIDGEELAKLMIDHNLGVTVKKTYELKEISNDYFEEDGSF